jgi:hypothetical protein
VAFLVAGAEAGGAAGAEESGEAPASAPEEPAAAAVRRLVALGLDPKEAMRRVARERGRSRRDIYREVLREKDDDTAGGEDGGGI